MQTKWPQFTTRDLDDTEDGAREFERRWNVYNDEMKALIAKGGVSLDNDSWWVCDATGELIGPDPTLERPLTDKDFETAKPFAEVVKKMRGRPKSKSTKVHTGLRLDPEVIAFFKGDDPKGWQTRVNEALRKVAGLD